MGLFSGITSGYKQPDQTQQSGGLFSGIVNSYNDPVARSQREAMKFQQESDYLNSPKGLFTETIKGIPGELKEAATATVGGAVEGWKSVQKPTSLGNALFEAGKGETETLTDSWSRATKAYKTLSSDATLSDKAIDTGMAGLGVVNALFTPISATLKVASGIPGIGVLANGIERIFASVGNGAGSLASEQLRELPISPEQKAKLDPLIRETASLVAMIAVGKGSEASFGKVKAKTDALVNEFKSIDPNYVAGAIDRTPRVGTNAPVKLNVTTDPTSYEPYIPDSQLPVIEAGKTSSTKSKSDIQANEAQPTAPAGMKYEWESEQTKPPVVATPSSTTQEKPGTFQSETAIKFNERLQDAGMDGVEVPWSKSRDTAQDRALADTIVRNNLQEGFDMVNGDTATPGKLPRPAVLNALMREAIRTNDPELAVRVAELIPKVSAEFGQGLNAFKTDTTFTADAFSEMADIIRARNSDEVARLNKIAKETVEPKIDDGAFLNFIKDSLC